ncbi:hypothetical protein Bca52824_076027 [Brassica carinata]|uniref:BHLH domain-containing protein n=1 Tax=Brassica carinata TaxID=52824 RepID=A0A8X7PTE3_BRACI|nr:hypothetical protein Bca52824_076027 [Brassica carinata]
MGDENNEGEMGFKHVDDESGISRVGVTSTDHFFSSVDWDPVVSGGGFSSSHYTSMVMDNPGMSCFPHYQTGSGYPDMPPSLLPFGDCVGGGPVLGSDKKGKSHQVSDDVVLGASPSRKRRQLEAESSQRNKKAVEEFLEEPQRGSDQSQKKHKNDQSKEKESSQSEEVRREKISERMRLLQELVPGCNKITGKAVMLDEIINYVQSLQQQVEFLSMKLATVNPELNIDIDRILAKDLMQSRDVSSTPTLGLNPFSGFQGTIPNTTLESELQSLYQMGFVSNPSTMSSFSPDNGRLKPEL